MFFLEIQCADTERDILVAEFWELGSTGMVETGSGMRVFFNDDALIPQLTGDFAKYSPTVTMTGDEDWIGYARAQTHPMMVGEKLFLAPEWRDDPTPEGRMRIGINPGMAFGTGSHETTRMCLEWLEHHVTPGVTVCDVGTGSGILAEASALFGASRIVACDVEVPVALIARDNIARASRDPLVYAGSAGALRGASADILVANISPDWIASLAGEWSRVLKPGGLGFFTGFDEQDLAMVVPALRKAGFVEQDVRAENAWRAIAVRR